MYNKYLKLSKKLWLSVYILFVIYICIKSIILPIFHVDDLTFWCVSWFNQFDLYKYIISVFYGVIAEVGFLSICSVLQLLVYKSNSKNHYRKVIFIGLLETIKIFGSVLSTIDLHFSVLKCNGFSYTNGLMLTAFIFSIVMLSSCFIADIAILVLLSLHKEINVVFHESKVDSGERFIIKNKHKIWVGLYSVYFLFAAVIAVVSIFLRHEEIAKFGVVWGVSLFLTFLMTIGGGFGIFSVLTFIQLVIYQVNKKFLLNMTVLLSVLEGIKIVGVIFFLSAEIIFLADCFTGIFVGLHIVVFILLTVLEITMLVHIKSTKKKQNTENPQLELIQQKN